MSTLQYKIFGIKYGDFRPANQSREALLTLIEKTALPELPPEISMIYAPQVDFTNQTADINENYDQWTPWFSRTKTEADGGFVCDNKTAIAFFNGDCPILCLQQGKKMAAMHAGYRCLIRKNSKEEGIIETTIRQFDPKRTKAFIFGGIGPCCWFPEYDDKPEILKLELCRHPEILKDCLAKTNNNSPFKVNHVSVDLYKLAAELLKSLGVLQDNISMDSRCTCCAKEKDKPVFWSYTRFMAGKQGDVNGRNLSVVWTQ